jgi:hypothetical protein
MLHVGTKLYVQFVDIQYIYIYCIYKAIPQFALCLSP